MPKTTYTPVVERRVVINHGPEMLDVCISELRQLEDRYAQVGEYLEGLREGPVRYSTLQRPVQHLLLDVAHLVRTLCRTVAEIHRELDEHQHQFTVAMVATPLSTTQYEPAENAAPRSGNPIRGRLVLGSR
jgi:hypothetical protein